MVFESLRKQLNTSSFGRPGSVSYLDHSFRVASASISGVKTLCSERCVVKARICFGLCYRSYSTLLLVQQVTLMKFLIYYLVQLITLNMPAEITDVDQICLVELSLMSESHQTCEVPVLSGLVFNSLYFQILS